MKLSFVLIGDSNDGYCRQSITSIRQWFPGAEILVSTSITPKDHLEWDKLILNEDPGELINTNHQGVKNLNRLIVNSYAGWEAASSEMVIRSRTDVKFFANSILEEYADYDNWYAERFLPKSVVENKILIGDMFTSMGLCYHPGDWVLMAPKDTLVEYYNVPLKGTNEISASPDHQLHRTEQYVFLANIWKHYDRSSVYIKYDVDQDQYQRLLSWQFLIDNFYISNRKDMGFNCIKYNYPYNQSWNHESYGHFYKKFTGN